MGALLSYEEAGAYLGVSRSTLKTLAGNMSLVTVKIGKRRLFPRADLDAYINALRSKSAA